MADEIKGIDFNGKRIDFGSIGKVKSVSNNGVDLEIDDNGNVDIKGPTMTVGW